MLDEHIEQANKMIQSQDSKIEHLYDQANYHSQRKHHYKELALKLTDDFHSLMTSYGELEQNQKSHIALASSLRAENDELIQQQKNQEELIRQAQASVFRSLEKAEWTPPEDGVIRQQLDNLYKEIKNWCKSASKKSVSDWGLDKLDIQKQGWESVWRDIAQFNENSSFPCGFSPGISDKKGWMLMSASLSKFVCVTMFQRPFSFMDHLTEGDTNIDLSDFNLNQGLNSLLSCMKMGKRVSFMIRGYSLCSNVQTGNGEWAPEVHSWRAETLRLLDPQNPESSPQTKGTLKNMTLSAREKVASRMAKEFVALVQSFLDKDNLEQLEKKVMRPAAELAYQLFTQKSCLQYKTIREGDDDYSLPATFSTTSTLMEPSSVHLGEDEEVLDGRLIALVLFPALVMRGDSEGTDYKRCRILKKAILWLADVPKEKPMPESGEDERLKSHPNNGPLSSV